MLRQSQLPPRAPTLRKPADYQLDEYTSLDRLEGSSSSTRHRKSLSQGSAPEDQWLNDLLTDLDTSPKRILHCRSASDSAAFLDNFTSHVRPSSGNDDESSASDESGNVLERDCVYGPNSPRGKVNSDFMESSMLTALSDYASQIKIPCVEEEVGWIDGPDQFDPEGDGHGSTEELNAESMAGKRHPRQRSRARKLQYIAKLERTVDALQALESELAFKVSTLAQQRVSLTVENRSLKQQMAMLRNRKLVMDREYQLLKKEAEMLRFHVAKTNSRNTTQIHRLIDAAEGNWSNKLDWAKLNLG